MMEAEGPKMLDIQCLLGGIFVSFEKVVSFSLYVKYTCKKILEDAFLSAFFWEPIPLKACLNVALILLPKINTVAEGKLIY